MIRKWIARIVAKEIAQAKKEAVRQAAKELDIAEVVKYHVETEVDKALNEWKGVCINSEDTHKQARALFSRLERELSPYFHLGGSSYYGEFYVKLRELIIADTFLAQQIVIGELDDTINRAIHDGSTVKATEALDDKLKSPEFIEELVTNLNRYQINNTGGIGK